MKYRILLPLLLITALAGVHGAVHAEKADRAKPMNIEADALRHDELKQTSVFTGRVVMTKGSIVLRGARLEVRQDADGYQTGVVTAAPGQRAFFRQKRDTAPSAPDEFVEGEGETIEYNGRADTVRFIKKAQLRRLRGATLADEVTGAVILYENLSDKFTVDGAPKSATAPAGRVRAMLTPKPDATAPAAAPQPGTSLRATPQLEKPAQ